MWNLLSNFESKWRSFSGFTGNSRLIFAITSHKLQLNGFSLFSQLNQDDLFSIENESNETRREILLNSQVKFSIAWRNYAEVKSVNQFTKNRNSFEFWHPSSVMFLTEISKLSQRTCLLLQTITESHKSIKPSCHPSTCMHGHH